MLPADCCLPVDGETLDPNSVASAAFTAAAHPL